MTQNSPRHWHYRIRIAGENSVQLKGPISDEELLKCVKQGEISPTTELCSPQKTQGHWLPAGRIGFLLKVYQSPSNPPSPSPQSGLMARPTQGTVPHIDLASQRDACAPSPVQCHHTECSADELPCPLDS